MDRAGLETAAEQGVLDEAQIYLLGTGINVYQLQVHGMALFASPSDLASAKFVNQTGDLELFRFGRDDPEWVIDLDSVSISSAVPEPSTWAMMLLGFAGLGFMAYRRKQNGSALVAA